MNKITVYKSSGKTEGLAWSKLKSSVKKACKATGDKPAQADLFADQVAIRLTNWLADKSEITTNDLRSQVQIILREFNSEASKYYQNFKEII